MNRCDSTGENSCPVCHDAIHIFAVGPCDHPVCYKCSTRMRVLCEQMDCPICRSTMPQVAFVDEKRLFKDINLRECIPNRKNKIFYENEDIEDIYLDLLEFRCRQCPKRKPERTFAQLQTHMRREHQLFACDICLTHLKIFPYETKFYDRKSLAVHRRMGDEDDKSYKGHPLCEFCDARYLDKDELLKHLRKDHFFCHFCDQEGSNAYYNDYPDLLEHFGESHYVCTEEECGSASTRFTHAFSSEIDLKSHKATVHNRKSRETRTIDVEFQFAPRHQGYSRGSGINSNDYEDSGTQRQRNRGYGNRRRQHDDPNVQRALEASLEEMVEAKAKPPDRVPDPIHDFPTLGGDLVSESQNAVAVEPQKPTTAQKPSKPVEDFPSLGSSNINGKKPQNSSHGSNKNYAAITHFTSEPRPVVKDKVKEPQPVSLGTVKGMKKDRWASQAPKVTEEDYPTLIGRSKPARPSSASDVNSTSTWLQKSVVFEEPSPTPVAPAVSVIMNKPSESNSQQRSSVSAMRPISNEEEFPSLGGSESRPASASMNILWSKQKPSAKRQSQVPKSKKIDEAFEFPDSYYKSYEPSEPYKQKDPSPENNSQSKKKSGTIDKKDFPDLPKREVDRKVLDKSSNVKQVANEAKELGAKIGETSGKKSKKSKKGTKDSKSLNDIAAGLLNVGATKSVVNGDKSKKKNENVNSKVSITKETSRLKEVKTDWFDNPPDMQENLNSKEPKPKKATASCNNFPSLHAMSPVVQRANIPPGFIPSSLQPQGISAPPGFSKPVPPGLSRPTFSASEYIQPPGFSSRNQALVKNIRSCLETVENGFDNFKSLSFKFRQGQINANDYYTNCQLLIGESDFKNIFPELLALLPDINKQQELWLEQQMIMSAQSSSKSKATYFKTLSSCPNCCQVILKADLQHHNLQHGDVQAFPSLSDATNKGAPDYSAPRPLKGAWIKAT